MSNKKGRGDTLCPVFPLQKGFQLAEENEDGELLFSTMGEVFIVYPDGTRNIIWEEDIATLPRHQNPSRPRQEVVVA